MDAPEVDVLFVETEDAFGPFGAKTLGEPPIIPSVAAVANAFFNATGRRIKDLPDVARTHPGRAGMKAFANVNPRTWTRRSAILSRSAPRWNGRAPSSAAAAATCSA